MKLLFINSMPASVIFNKFRPWSESKLFDILTVFMKEFVKIFDFEKKHI